MDSSSVSKKFLSTRPKEIDLGKRSVSSMNYSYIVTLPKEFVVNTNNGKIVRVVKIIMLEDGSLILTPVFDKDEPAQFSIM